MMPAPPEPPYGVGRVAIHVRRGDRLGRAGATNTYPIARVASLVNLSATMLANSNRFAAGVHVDIYTEPDNSSEVFERGCPRVVGDGGVVFGGVLV